MSTTTSTIHKSLKKNQVAAQEEKSLNSAYLKKRKASPYSGKIEERGLEVLKEQLEWKV